MEVWKQSIWSYMELDEIIRINKEMESMDYNVGIGVYKYKSYVTRISLNTNN